MNNIIASQSGKRPGSAIVGASGSGAKKRSRKPVEIPEDVWLDALKNLNCSKWSKMRLVSSQLNGMVGRNVSRLPLVIVDYAAMVLKDRKRIETKIIISDSAISPNTKWFKNGGMTLDVPADIELNKAVIAADLKEDSCIDLCVLGPAQEKELNNYGKGRPWFSGNKWLPGKRYQSNVFFYGEFNPLRSRFSAASLAFFLKLLYDPSTFVKELPMYAFDKKLKDILFAGEEDRYIGCGTFTLMGEINSVADACEAILWMEKNVRADTIKFPKNVNCYKSEFCEAICNYVLGSSWISASQVVDLQKVEGHYHFFKAFIKKFRTVGAVQSNFPIVVFFGYRSFYDPVKNLLDEESKVKEKLEDADDDNDPENAEGDDESQDSEDDSDDSEDLKSSEIYTISSGSNQMRIEFARKNAKNRKVPCVIPWLPATTEYPYDVRITMKARK